MAIALYITLVGMAITFACLGVVLLIMAVIGRLFPGREGEADSKKD